MIAITFNDVCYIVYYSAFRFTSIPPAAESRYRTPPALTPANESSYRTISYGGTSPWNSTGFAYTPRYPQSYRGITFLLKMLISVSKTLIFVNVGNNEFVFIFCLSYYRNSLHFGTVCEKVQL